MWFSARAIYQSIHSGKPDPRKFQELSSDDLDQQMFEESIFLVRADNLESAEQSARELGYRRQLSYENPYGETVTWNLMDLVEVQELDEEHLGHGTEVFSRHFTRKKGDTRPFDY